MSSCYAVYYENRGEDNELVDAGYRDCEHAIEEISMHGWEDSDELNEKTVYSVRDPLDRVVAIGTYLWAGPLVTENGVVRNLGAEQLRWMLTDGTIRTYRKVETEESYRVERIG